jgi:NTE family protein
MSFRPMTMRAHTTMTDGTTHRDPTASRKLVNIALQGGGSHGAFAWGALDSLLEDERIEIEGLVGTSAGAMNAAVTAYGLLDGGKDGARRALCNFWRAVAARGACSIMQPSLIDQLRGPGNLDFSPGWITLDLLTRLLSPYQMNPTNYHPLREILLEQIDFERLRRVGDVKLFVCASNVMTNRLRVFQRSEISVDAVLASACLPNMFQAVEIEGEHYWDGGYMGNPPIFPLIYDCTSRDVILILINPIEIAELPTTAQAILDRINTLSFNSSLMREMRAIAFISKLVDRGFDDGGQLKKMLIHCIDGEDQLRTFGVSSKLNVDSNFLTRLFDLGRGRGEAFLRDHFGKIGKQSSVDIENRFL